MRAAETITQLYDSDSFVLDEVKRLQFFYGLKREIRYGEERSDESNPESVAEHVYGMYVLMNYFLPLEDAKGDWDRHKIEEMILLHDVDEVITGDKVGYLKTDADIDKEKEALLEVYESIPSSMSERVRERMEEYHRRESIEAKFVKAIDKIEPVIHLYNAGGKELLLRMGTTFEQNASIKVKYFEEFPIIMRMYKVTSEKMRAEGFFREET